MDNNTTFKKNAVDLYIWASEAAAWLRATAKEFSERDSALGNRCSEASRELDKIVKHVESRGEIS